MEPLPAGTTSRRATTRWRLWRASWAWSRRGRGAGGGVRGGLPAGELDGAVNRQEGGLEGAWRGEKEGGEDARHSAVVRSRRKLRREQRPGIGNKEEAVPEGLIIVESPAKAKTLKRFLGDRFDVRASMGHVRDLPEKEMGVEVDDGFKPHYEVVESRRKTINELKAAAKGEREVILASDPDREGEAIAWHLAEVLKLRDPKRIEFHEITSDAVRRALESPRVIDMRLVNAQQARRVVDRLVGLRLSPFLWAQGHDPAVHHLHVAAGRLKPPAHAAVCHHARGPAALRRRGAWRRGPDRSHHLYAHRLDPDLRRRRLEGEGLDQAAARREIPWRVARRQGDARGAGCPRGDPAD